MLKFRAMKIRKSKSVKECFLCKCKDFRDLGESKCPVLTSKHHLAKCKRCGFVFVNPMPDEKELSQIYSTEYRLGYQSWLGKILDIYNNFVFTIDANFIKHYINTGRVIDIGYGSGGMLTALGPGWDKYGYDAYSEEADRIQIKKQLGIKILSSLTKLKDNFFDLVILRNVIEHTSNFKQLFVSAQRLLKPGGQLFIRTPNIESLDFKIFGPNWYMTYMGGHLVFFSLRTLSQTAKLFNFTPIILHPTLISPILSFQRNVLLKFSTDNKYLAFLLLPISILYSFFSLFFRNGNDLLAILRKS